jgi:Gpi18-like mannosyltransferase
VIKKLLFLFIVAFVFRFLLINVAFHGDLYNNISWGNMALKGLNGFYEKTAFQYSIPNQPPLYILLFAITSFIYQTITNLSWYLNNNLGIFPSSFVWFWQTSGMIILVKLPSIFADLGIAYIIYKKVGFKFALLWLLNPITWYNSSIWGQTDSIVNLLGLISIIALLNKKLIPSILFFVLSILFKGSLMIFLPILLIVWILQKHNLRQWVKAILISGLAIILTTVWFHPSLDLPIWLFNLYTQRFFPGEIGYLTANAFNLWYLINPGRVLDSIKYFGITAHTIGYITVSIIVIALIAKKQKTLKQEKTILLMLAVMALSTFLFFTRIHERYLYPFFPVATILVGLVPEFIIPYVVLSFVFLLNMYNLFWAPGIPILENILIKTALPNILSVINLFIFSSFFVWAIIKEQ